MIDRLSVAAPRRMFLGMGRVVVVHGPTGGFALLFGPDCTGGFCAEAVVVASNPMQISRSERFTDISRVQVRGQSLVAELIPRPATSMNFVSPDPLVPAVIDQFEITHAFESDESRSELAAAKGHPCVAISAGCGG